MNPVNLVLVTWPNGENPIRARGKVTFVALIPVGSRIHDMVKNRRPGRGEPNFRVCERVPLDDGSQTTRVPPGSRALIIETNRWSIAQNFVQSLQPEASAV